MNNKETDISIDDVIDNAIYDLITKRKSQGDNHQEALLKILERLRQCRHFLPKVLKEICLDYESEPYNFLDTMQNFFTGDYKDEIKHYFSRNENKGLYDANVNIKM